MAYKITEIEGIGPALAEKFAAADVKTTEGLLEKGGSAAGRKALAEATGLDAKRILRFVSMADLMRVNGVGGEFAELLKGSGVDTIKELRTRNATNLQAKMAEVNAEKKLTRTVPSVSQVEKMIASAKEIEPTVTH